MTTTPSGPASLGDPPEASGARRRNPAFRGAASVTTAFVLSGGGSLGAVQVGMLRALAVRSVTPDSFVGTSVGALNAAFVAGHGFNDDTLEVLMPREATPAKSVRAETRLALSA